MVYFVILEIQLYQLKYKNIFSRIENRGPDYSILQQVNNVSLGFHRLSINDLSKSGNQPFTLNGVFLICNGEIYIIIF